MSSRLLAFVFSNGMVEKQKRGEIFTISQNHDQFKSNKASFFLFSLKKNIRLGIRLVTQSKIEVATIRGKSSGIKSRFFCTTKGKEPSMTPKNTSLIRCDSFLPLSFPPPHRASQTPFGPALYSPPPPPTRFGSHPKSLVWRRRRGVGRRSRTQSMRQWPGEKEKVWWWWWAREKAAPPAATATTAAHDGGTICRQRSDRRRSSWEGGGKETIVGERGKREGRALLKKPGYSPPTASLLCSPPPSVAPSPAKAAAAGSLREKSFWVSTKNGGGNR